MLAVQAAWAVIRLGLGRVVLAAGTQKLVIQGGQRGVALAYLLRPLVGVRVRSQLQYRTPLARSCSRPPC